LSTSNKSSDIVSFNVGGKIYSTSRSTINRYSRSKRFIRWQQQKRETPPPTTAATHDSQQKTQSSNLTQTREAGQARGQTPPTVSSSSSQQQESTGNKSSTGSSEPPKRKTSTGEAPSSQALGRGTTQHAHEEIVRSKDKKVYAVVSAPDDTELHQQTTGTHVSGGHSTSEGTHHSTTTSSTFAHGKK